MMCLDSSPIVMCAEGGSPGEAGPVGSPGRQPVGPGPGSAEPPGRDRVAGAGAAARLAHNRGSGGPRPACPGGHRRCAAPGKLTTTCTTLQIRRSDTTVYESLRAYLCMWCLVCNLVSLSQCSDVSLQLAVAKAGLRGRLASNGSILSHRCGRWRPRPAAVAGRPGRWPACTARSWAC